MTNTTLSRCLGLGLALALVAGCNRTAPEATHQADQPAHKMMAAPPAAGGAAPSGLDKRTPLPLTEMMATHQKEEMRDHLRVVQEITTALATDDFDAIAASAARIAWSDKQAMMCKHMGAGAPGFTEVGEHFHHTADGIVEAAKHRDHNGVATALGATLQTCIGCHDTYRQDIVDDDAFAKFGVAMDHSMMHGK
jgi:hypothetical protein